MFVNKKEISNIVKKNAIELGLIYVTDDIFRTPNNWHSGLQGINVDLSATGSDKDQIMRSVAIQLSQSAKLSEDYLILLIKIHHILTTDYPQDNKKEIEIAKWIADFEIKTNFL